MPYRPGCYSPVYQKNLAGGTEGGGATLTLLHKLMSTQRFETRGKLGQGAYGVVLKCRDISSGNVVAVKKLRSQPTSQEELSSALREAQLLQQAQHENVVKLLDAYQSASGNVCVQSRSSDPLNL